MTACRLCFFSFLRRVRRYPFPDPVDNSPPNSPATVAYTCRCTPESNISPADVASASCGPFDWIAKVVVVVVVVRGGSSVNRTQTRPDRFRTAYALSRRRRSIDPRTGGGGGRLNCLFFYQPCGSKRNPTDRSQFKPSGRTGLKFGTRMAVMT